MKHFNELLQEKLNSYEYPYEQGAWEKLRHKMLMKKILRWATVGIVAVTVVSTTILLVPSNEIKPSIRKDIKNNIVSQSIVNKEVSVLQEKNHVIQHNASTINSTNVEVADNTSQQTKTSDDFENKMVANDLQNNGAFINNPISISFTKDVTQGCEPLQVRFTSNSSPKINSCVWDFGDGTTSFEANPVHLYKKGGKYKVVLTVKTNDGKTVVSEPQQIQVFSKPKALFEYSMDDNCVQLKNNSKQSTFQNWYFNDSLMSDEMVKVCIKKSDIYRIALVVGNNEGCSDSAVQKIELKYSMPVKFADAFTPDGDGINDLFGPIVADYSQYEFKMFIYKKEGKCVHEYMGSPVNWDGTDQTTKQLCPADIYYYKVIAVDKKGNKQEFFGKINLKQ